MGRQTTRLLCKVLSCYDEVVGSSDYCRDHLHLGSRLRSERPMMGGPMGYYISRGSPTGKEYPAAQRKSKIAPIEEEVSACATTSSKQEEARTTVPRSSFRGMRDDGMRPSSSSRSGSSGSTSSGSPGVEKLNRRRSDDKFVQLYAHGEVVRVVEDTSLTDGLRWIANCKSWIGTVKDFNGYTGEYRVQPLEKYEKIQWGVKIAPNKEEFNAGLLISVKDRIVPLVSSKEVKTPKKEEPQPLVPVKPGCAHCGEPPARSSVARILATKQLDTDNPIWRCRDCGSVYEQMDNAGNVVERRGPLSPDFVKKKKSD